MGAKKIRTTPYHPAAYVVVERLHRTMKAAFMCDKQVPWPELLPTVLLRLRTSFKEDLKASPADLLYGQSLRVPGEFFTSQEEQIDPQIFIEIFREHMRGGQSTPAAHHIKARMFVLKNLYTATHVFLRCDAVTKPLEQPYSGPRRVIRRINDRLFTMEAGGEEKTIPVDRLKRAYIAKEDTDGIEPAALEVVQPHHRRILWIR